MAFGATALKLFQTFFYALAFCCSTIILGLYSYFLATQAQHNVAIPRWQKAVEGISGIGVVYTIFAVVLTCCLGGKIFFAFLAIILDLLLCAGFVAIAILTRSGHSCSGDNVRTPLGDGARDSHTGRDGAIYTPSLATSCHLNQVVFAVAVIGAFIFAFSAIVQLWMGRHHQKQKRYGPSPANNYTKGNGIKFWKRKHGARSAHAAVAKDAEVHLLPLESPQLTMAIMVLTTAITVLIMASTMMLTTPRWLRTTLTLVTNTRLLQHTEPLSQLLEAITPRLLELESTLTDMTTPARPRQTIKRTVNVICMPLKDLFPFLIY